MDREVGKRTALDRLIFEKNDPIRFERLVAFNFCFGGNLPISIELWSEIDFVLVEMIEMISIFGGNGRGSCGGGCDGAGIGEEILRGTMELWRLWRRCDRCDRVEERV